MTLWPIPDDPGPNPSGLCMCGCGQTTTRARRNSTLYGHAQGEHVRYAQHHNPGAVGDHNTRWRGGRYLDERGYVRLSVGTTGYLYEHVLEAERKIGRPLGRHEVVHHSNGERSDNRPENLVVMARAEHTVLHNPGGWRRTA